MKEGIGEYEIYGVRIVRDSNQYRTVKRDLTIFEEGKGVTFQRSHCVEGCHNSKDLRPAFRVLKKLYSKSKSQKSTIKTADGMTVSEVD